MNAPLIIAFVLLFALTGAIGAVSKRFASHAPRPERDRSGMVLGLAHTASMIAGAVSPWLGVGALPVSPAFAWGAVVVMVLAFALAMWSMLTLRAFFSLSLATDAAQPVIDRGPYALVRHPGYLGQIVFFVAFGLATQNALALAVIIAGALIGYGYRIRAEERLLAATLGDRYEAYASKRARLVPFVF